MVVCSRRPCHLHKADSVPLAECAGFAEADGDVTHCQPVYLDMTRGGPCRERGLGGVEPS